MLDLLGDARELLDELDFRSMSNSAYDTAWVARVPSNGASSGSAFPEALDWLRQNQYPDGSWGGEVKNVSVLSLTKTMKRTGPITAWS